MAYYKTLPCDVAAAYYAEQCWRYSVDGSGPGPCEGRVEVMHLRSESSQHRAPDYRTAPGCKRHHVGIDGAIGGRAPWYVALGREGQRALREALVARADLKWSTLTGRERDDWQARATSREP
jgi:hypothetical protein